MIANLHLNPSINLVFNQTSVRAKKRILKEFIQSMSDTDTQQYSTKIEQSTKHADLDRLAIDILSKEQNK